MKLKKKTETSQLAVFLLSGNHYEYVRIKKKTMVESLLNKGGGAVRYRATFLKSAISMSHIEY